MSILPPLIYGLGLLLVLATALSLWRVKAWWVRLFDFPRVQIALLIAAVFAAALFVLDALILGNLVFLGALGVAFLYQLYRILRYTPLVPKQVVQDTACPPERRFRLLVANVLEKNRRAKAFLRRVRESDPDLILVLETDHWWAEQLSALDADYPYAVKRPIDNTYGMMLFSRLELDRPEVRCLLEEDVPSIYTAVRLRSGEWIDFYGVHPRPPYPAQDTDERDAELLIVGREVRRTGRPAIVAGDLNDVAWSRTTRLFLKVSGLLDPRIGRGPYSTFHARYPGMRWPLDHVFHEASFTLVGMRRLRYFGSDHFPVLAEFCYRPRAEAVQDAPDADREERQQAKKEIRQGLRAAEDS